MTVSLAFFKDAALTQPGSTLDVAHESDGSTDPVDVTAYLGSVTTGVQFRASSDPGVDDITVSIGNVTPERTNSGTYAINDEVRSETANGYKYRATSAGDAAGSPPTWPTTIGQTVVDGDITWECISKIHEASEVKLALSSGGLDSAVAGDPLVIGTSITGGDANAIPVYIRVDDDTETVGVESELTLTTNSVDEDPV